MIALLHSIVLLLLLRVRFLGQRRTFLGIREKKKNPAFEYYYFNNTRTYTGTIITVIIIIGPHLFVLSREWTSTNERVAAAAPLPTRFWTRGRTDHNRTTRVTAHV